MGIKVSWRQDFERHEGRIVEFIVRQDDRVQAVVVDSIGLFHVVDVVDLQEEA